MAGFVTVQGKIAVTGTPQQLPANAARFQTFTIAAKTGNTAPIVVTVSNAAGTGAADGTGTGYILAAGASVIIPALNNTNTIWVTGTANDVYSGIGA